MIGHVNITKIPRATSAGLMPFRHHAPRVDDAVACVAVAEISVSMRRRTTSNSSARIGNLCGWQIVALLLSAGDLAPMGSLKRYFDQTATVVAMVVAIF
jgi:hypothetical protein